MKKILLISIFFASLRLCAQEDCTGEDCTKEIFENTSDEFKPEIVKRNIGDSRLTLSIGTFFPLFFQETATTKINKTNLIPVGAGFALGWGIFLSDGFNLGIEIAPAFTFGRNGSLFFNLPIGAKFSYYLRVPGKIPVEIPLFISLGFIYTSYKSLYYPGFYLKPGIAVYADVFANWSLGVSVDYMIAPQIYYGENAKYFKVPKSQSRVGNFLEILFSIEYNF